MRGALKGWRKRGALAQVRGAPAGSGAWHGNLRMCARTSTAMTFLARGPPRRAQTWPPPVFSQAPSISDMRVSGNA